MASNPNADYYGRDDLLHKNETSYFQNDGYAGLNAGFASGQGQPAGQWVYQPEGLSGDASLYRGWHDAPYGQRASSNMPHDNQNDFYARHYASNSSQGGAAAHDVHGRQSQIPYESTIAPQSTLSNDNRSLQNTSFANSNLQSGTIAPGALQSNSQLTSSEMPGRPAKQSSSTPVPSPTPVSFQVPKGTASGNFMIVSLEALNQVTNSTQLHHFLNAGQDAQDLSINKSTIPTYNPRKSRNEIKKLVASDSKLAAKIAKKPVKEAKGTKPKSVASRPSQSPGAGTSSEDDSDAESSDEEPQPPLPAVRPSTAKGATKYDSIKALWRDPSRSLSNDEIRKGIADFWEVIRTIRDRWKADTEAVKQAEEAKNTGELPIFQERVASQRELFETAARAAVDNGHPEILEYLGLNLLFIISVAQVLQDRLRSGDYSGTLPKVLLELLTKAHSLTEANLERTGVGKLIDRLQKKGDENIAKLAKKVSENARAASSKKKDTSKGGATPATVSKEKKTPEAASPPKAGSPTTGAKRSRPGENSGEQASKRIAAEGSRSTITANGQSKPEQAAKRSTPSTDIKSSATSGSATLTKPKTNPTISKPSGFFSALQSAKKVSTPATATSSAPKPTAAPATERPAPAPAPKTPAFSLSQVMASIEKPKDSEKQPTKPEEPVPEESPEEKAKRLRKQERRKLRVTFRPESQLVQIHYFKHDPEEELGHDENQIRDVGDVESEGRMFKLKHQEDMMDIDEEDEESDEFSELFSKPYHAPTAIDFSTLSDVDRNQNYETRGGEVKPNCPERWLQEHREGETLMVVYAQASDIPPSPKEPVTDAPTDSEPPKMFGPPDDRILSRLQEVERAEQAAGTPNMPINASNISSILSAMKAAPAQFPEAAQVPPQQPTAQESSKSQLEQIFAKFAAPNQQQQTPQVPNMAGLFASQDPKPSFDSNTAYQQQPAPNVADLSSLLASLQSGKMPPVPPIPFMPNMQGMNFPPPPNLLDFNQQAYNPPQVQQPQADYPFENEERRRLREGGGGSNDADEQSQGPRKFDKQKRPWLKSQKDERGLPFKVVQCKYWVKDKCTKGDSCTFLHE